MPKKTNEIDNAARKAPINADVPMNYMVNETYPPRRRSCYLPKSTYF